MAWGSAWGSAWGDSWTASPSAEKSWACNWGQAWGDSWGDTSSCVATPEADKAWACAWAKSWGDAWGDTSACVVPEPEPEPEETPSAGRPWGFWPTVRRVDDEDDSHALQAVAELAEQQAEALARVPRFDPAESLEQLADALEAAGAAFDRRYVDLLAQARAYLLAQTLERAAMEAAQQIAVAEWARLEQQEFLRRQRNQNALRVLMLMSLH